MMLGLKIINKNLFIISDNFFIENIIKHRGGDLCYIKSK
jgi:hypothetical protein